MHILDHHSVASVLCGSIIMKCIRQVSALGDTIDGRLKEVNKLVKEHQRYNRTSSRTPILRVLDLVTRGWWDLHGTLIKAANTRQVCPFVEQLATFCFPARLAYNDAMVG